MPLPPRIILIGFMGSGKTTVGRILSRRLSYDLVDTDGLIEARAGTSIARIFAIKGETAFRDIESAVLAALAHRERVVVATGGGAPAQARNRGFFTKDAATFHLRVSFVAASARTRGDPGRPLMGGKEDSVRRLYESRQPVYEELGVPVETDARSADAVADEIFRILTGPRRTGHAEESA